MTPQGAPRPFYSRKVNGQGVEEKNFLDSLEREFTEQRIQALTNKLLGIIAVSVILNRQARQREQMAKRDPSRTSLNYRDGMF